MKHEQPVFVVISSHSSTINANARHEVANSLPYPYSISSFAPLISKRPMAKKETRAKRAQKARKEDYLITGGNTRKKKQGVKSAPKRNGPGAGRKPTKGPEKPFAKGDGTRGRKNEEPVENKGPKRQAARGEKDFSHARQDRPARSRPVRRAEGGDFSESRARGKNDGADRKESFGRPNKRTSGGRREDNFREPRFEGPRHHFNEKRPNRRFKSDEADESRENNRYNTGKFARGDHKRSAKKFLSDKHFAGMQGEGRGRKEELTRLNKYLAIAGIASRREADKFIADGLVTVNGEVVTEMGYKVKPGDEVKYAGERIKAEPLRYVLLNKPKDVITTMDDERGRATVMNLVKNACRERIFPVGRLDRNTTGLLLFTNDGDLAKKLTHPSHDIRKVYHVILDKNVTQADLKKLEAGVELEDGIAKADVALYVGDGSVPSEVGLEIHSGKNRIVRRMFEALGYKVVRLDRAVFAGLSKKGLPRGRWRFLTEKEVEYLRML